MPENPRWIPIVEAAQIIGISVPRLRTICKAREIDHRRDGRIGRPDKDGQVGAFFVREDIARNLVVQTRPRKKKCRDTARFFPSNRPQQIVGRNPEGEVMFDSQSESDPRDAQIASLQAAVAKATADHHTLLINTTMTDAARRSGALQPEQTAVLLRQAARVVHEDGKSPSVVIEDASGAMSPAAAFAKLRASFGYLYGEPQEDLGGNVDIRSLSQAQYNELRERDPGKLGLRPLKR